MFFYTMEETSLENVQKQISTCFSVYEKYAWLLNCYVLDFFTDHHWNKLLTNWQLSLKDLNATDISKLLDYKEEMRGRMWPLSISALKTILVSLSLSRKMIDLKIESPLFTKDEKLLCLFWKNVKAKKRHEISIISKICYESACKTDCFYIVDIGSGLGHLSRMLNYGYGFKVCTIEAQASLSRQAQILDEEFEVILKKKVKGNHNYQKIFHINMRIETTIAVSEFLSIVKKGFNIENDDFKVGIVGLHPCGDLGATLLRLYNECNSVQFINIVGCCYMKLTTMPEPTHGFPLSNFCKINKYNLSYHSREIACHAIENYIEKLRKNECWRLKIHTYRAILEKIISQKCPEYHHCALNNVKYTEDLSFHSYCKKATQKLKIDFSEMMLEDNETEDLLKQWKEVVVFYSLRLLFAPLIESVILLDRFMFVTESGSKAEILPVFDAKISPRAHVLTARKTIKSL